MTIKVHTHDTSVAAPVALELINSSGANVEVFIFIGDLPAIHRAFDFSGPVVPIPVNDLKPGSYPTMVIVRALKNLNRMYSLLVGFNGEIAAVADGDIPDESNNDSGSGSLTLTVT